MAKRTMNLDTKDIELIIDALGNLPKSSRADSLFKKMRNNLKTIKVSSRKGKGRSLQKYICREIGDMIKVPYDQEDDQCLIHSREMGQAGVDVILRGKAQKLFPYSIETKASESFNMTSTIQQAENNTEEGLDWMVIHKRKILQDPIVLISWPAFKKLFLKKS